MGALVDPRSKVRKVAEQSEASVPTVRKSVKGRRDDEIRCRLTADEKHAVTEAANQMGISVSDYTRIALRKMMGVMR